MEAPVKRIFVLAIALVLRSPAASAGATEEGPPGNLFGRERVNLSGDWREIFVDRPSSDSDDDPVLHVSPSPTRAPRRTIDLLTTARLPISQPDSRNTSGPIAHPLHRARHPTRPDMARRSALPWPAGDRSRAAGVAFLENNSRVSGSEGPPGFDTWVRCALVPL